MKPKPDSLKEEIEKIITNIFDRVDNSTWKEARDQATTAILELIEKRLPSPTTRSVDSIGDDTLNEDYQRGNYDGYNQCLLDIRKEMK